jgi:hypothetical protein
MKPVIVGIDGSQAAIAAAFWAADEATTGATAAHLGYQADASIPGRLTPATSRMPRHRCAKHKSRLRPAGSPSRSRPKTHVVPGRPTRGTHRGCGWRVRTSGTRLAAASSPGARLPDYYEVRYRQLPDRQRRASSASGYQWCRG